ncbi:uncharacterized protein [Argopecten irradians]|uniref:uncharacterized protein n=1 Tax=Argopecten irradians TaxID=31199 RepID=UPI003712192A
MTIKERTVYSTRNVTILQSPHMEKAIPQKDMSATMCNSKLNLSNTIINTPPEVDKTTTSTKHEVDKTTTSTPSEVDTTAKDNPVSYTTKTSPLTKSIVSLTIGTVLMMCLQPSFAAEPYIEENFVLININEIARVLRSSGQDRLTIRMENISIERNVTVREYHRTMNNSDVNTASAAADLHDDDDDEDDDGSGSYRVRNNETNENVAAEDNQVTDSDIMDGYAAVLDRLPQTVNEHFKNMSTIRPADMNSSLAINSANDTRSEIFQSENMFEKETYIETIQRSVPNNQLVISNQPFDSENPDLIDVHAINNDVTEATEQSAVNTSTSERGLLVISEQRVSNSSGSTNSDTSSNCPPPTGSVISRYHEAFNRSAGVSVLSNEDSKQILSEERHQQIDQRHQTLISGTRESTALQLFGRDHQYSENIESPIEDTMNSPGIMVITGQTRATDDRDTIYRVLGQRPQARDRTAVTLYHPTEVNDGENGNHGALVVTERYRQPLRPAVGHQLLVTPINPGTDPHCPINQPSRLAAMTVSGRSQWSNPVILPVPSDRVLAANTNGTAVPQDNGSDIDR